MTSIYQELQALVGKDVEFLKGVEQYDVEYDVGMRATIISIDDGMNSDPDDPCLQIHFTFDKFEDYNRSFESASYYDKHGDPTMTAREAGYYNVQSSLYVGNNWAECVKLVDPAAEKLFSLFMVDKEANPDLSYVKWLEALVLAAMPHLKADG